jgi:hypothetical protein
VSSDKVLRVQCALGPRDHQLLQWLRDHGVLTTPQIAHALFPSLDFAQRRLTRLIDLDLVDRFRPLRQGGGSYPYHYVIDQLGAEVVAAQRDEPPPRPGYARLNRRRWTHTSNLPHRLGITQFFTDLAGHARTHPDHALTRWWSERRCARTGAFGRPDGLMDLRTKPAPIHPDGHGIWSGPHGRVPFFYEYDTGTEPLTELMRKMIGYARLVNYGGPAWPVLFRLNSTEREHNLHDCLGDTPMAVSVATAVLPDLEPDDSSTKDSHQAPVRPRPDPAGPCWWLHGHHRRLALAEFASVVDGVNDYPDHAPD